MLQGGGIDVLLGDAPPRRGPPGGESGSGVACLPQEERDGGRWVMETAEDEDKGRDGMHEGRVDERSDQGGAWGWGNGSVDMNLCSTEFNTFWGLSYNITYKIYINVSLITALMIRDASLIRYLTNPFYWLAIRDN